MHKALLNIFRVSLLAVCIIVNLGYSNAHANVYTLAYSVQEFEASLKSGDVLTPKIIPLPEELSVFNGSRDTDVLASYIIGGNNASRNEYPEFALVLITDNQGNIVGLCGGSLIASNKILTAAHCSQESASRYFILPNFYSFNDNVTANDFYRVSRVAVHPEYTGNVLLGHDLAVLTCNALIP